jgi:hypothetical protein
MALWGRKKEPEPKVKVELPPQRVSVEDDQDLLAYSHYIIESYAPMANKLPFELYDYVELLAMYNPDFNQAVDNIKNLANPGFKILANAAQESNAQAFRDRIKQKNKTIKPRMGGFHGIANNLIRQAAVYGAMCGEWVVNKEISDIVDFAFVNPKSIRFFWDTEKNDWHPYQKASLTSAPTEANKFGFIKLNTTTFYYQTVYTINNNPYGIPPLIAALEPLSIQREMINNLKSITKKLGMLGILEVIIERLPQMPDETPQEYMSRCNSFLTNYQTLIKDMVNEGGVVHFDDTKIDNLSIAERVQGAADIFKLNEEQGFSGLHSLPSVQGRSYSTTETYAGVAYELLLRSMGDFTSAVKYILEQGCWLMNRLWGTNVGDIDFVFGENKSLNLLQTAQAEAILLNNDMWMWENGMLDQSQVGQRHGIDSPVRAMEAPVTPPERGGQTMAAQVAESIYKNAINVKLGDHNHDPNTIGRDTRAEYANNLISMFKPVRTLAKELVEETVEKLS